MRVKIKPSAKKLLSGSETAPCWYCENPTQYSIIERDGSEIWCCISCGKKHYNIKKIKRLTNKTLTQGKKVENSNILHEKKKESSVISNNLEGLE